MKRHDGADPSCLLETDWMTEEVSSGGYSDEERNATHKSRLQVKAGLSAKEIGAKVPVWECIEPLFLSREVNPQVQLMQRH